MAPPILTAFVTATADLKAAQAEAVEHIRSLGRSHRGRCNLKPFAGATESRYPATASDSSRAVIDTVLARAGIVLCLFGETLGAPLPEDFPFPGDFRLADLPAGVVHPWPPEPAAPDLIPLSGPVFELLYALARVARAPQMPVMTGHDSGVSAAGPPTVMTLFHGDGSRHPPLRALLAHHAADSADFADRAGLLHWIEQILTAPLGMAEAGAGATSATALDVALADDAGAAGRAVAADLETAVRAGDLAQVRACIATSPGVLAQVCSDGGSLLHLAVRQGQLALVELFLQPRYAPWVVLEQRDHDGRHLLEMALQLPDLRIAECLLKRAPQLAGLNLRDGFPPLVFAVVNRCDAVVERLMHADLAAWRQPANGAVVPMLPPGALPPETLAQQLCVVLADGATHFAGLALSAPPATLRAQFADLRRRKLFGQLDDYDPALLRCAALPFLPGTRLLLARHASAGISVPFLVSPDGEMVLALREHAVYRSRLNRWRKATGKELDDGQLIAYVRFSFAIALVTELGIRPVERAGQLPWRPETAPAERAAGGSQLTALHMLAPYQQAPVIGGTFLRADQLYRGSIEIDPSMHFRLTLDACLVEKLPIAHSTAELFVVRA